VALARDPTQCAQRDDRVTRALGLRLFAVTAMLVCYRDGAPARPGGRSAFTAACVLGSAYGFLQGAWPFGLVEAVWAGQPPVAPGP